MCLGLLGCIWSCLGLLGLALAAEVCCVCLTGPRFAEIFLDLLGHAGAYLGLLGLPWVCLGLLDFLGLACWLDLPRLACDSLGLHGLGLKLGLVLSWLVLSCLLLPRHALPCRVSSLVLDCLVWSGLI